MEPKKQTQEDFFSLYLRYTGETESPTFFHRWTAIACLAAWVGRDIHFPFGHFKIHANMYTMLVGLAGTKKSTAIKIGADLLESAGYDKFAADKTRQEKFLIDMAEESSLETEEDILDKNIFGDLDASSLPPAECFVAADEINNFIGVGNLDFMSLLGDLWDRDKPFKYKLKNSDSVVIPYPTINILGGNTFTGLNRLFPPEAIEQGFFSRLLFIHAEPTGVKYTIPGVPCQKLKARLIEELQGIKMRAQGIVTIAPEAYTLLDGIYKKWEGISDARFDAYENRRLQHLIKICMLAAVVRRSMKIELQDIIYGNTILTYTETFMPKALGEFGRSRHSDTAHKVMMALEATLLPMSLQSLWKIVHADLDRREQLAEILVNLIEAEKIQSIRGTGYLPIKKLVAEGVKGAINWNLLTEEERDKI